MAGKNARRVTLLEVAREAGVSHMTVSRVVRGVEVVKSGTVRRVRDALRRLDYRPDPLLSALAAYRTGGGGGSSGQVIAFLDGEQSAYSRVVQEGAEHEARLLGYGLESFALPLAEKAQRRLGRMLFHRGIKGLLFGPAFAPHVFAGWDWAEFTAVSLGALSHRPAMHSVAMDYFHGAVTACELLREAGCRRIGFAIDARLEMRTGHRWLGGYLASLGRNEARRVLSSVSDPRAVRAWAGETRVDGLLTIHGEISRVLMRDGVRVAHLNDTNRLPGVPCCSLEPGKIGIEGVRLLHPLLMKNECGLPAEPKVVSLRGVWDMGGV